MTEQTVEMVGYLTPRPYRETVQNRRCWALLNHIVRKEIAIKAPAIIKARTKRKRAD